MREKDLSLRLQTLEAVAGQQPGTWSSNPMRGWSQMLAWAEDEPALDPAWLDTKTDYGFWTHVERAVTKRFWQFSGNTSQMRNTSEEVFQSVLMGIPLGSGGERDPLYYGLGLFLKTGIRAGAKEPEDVLKLAIRRGGQIALEELKTSGNMNRRRDEDTDLTHSVMKDDRNIRQLPDSAQGRAPTPGDGSLYEFLGGNKREVTRAVVDAVADGFNGDTNSAIWQRMLDVWLGRVPRLQAGAASGQQLDLLLAATGFIRDNPGRPVKFKTLGENLGLSPKVTSSALKALGKKIIQFLDNEKSLEAFFDSPAMRNELQQVVRVARTRKKEAAQRVASRYLTQR